MLENNNNKNNKLINNEIKTTEWELKMCIGNLVKEKSYHK